MEPRRRGIHIARILLLNADSFSCPDGIVLRDPLALFVDAISYEGQVPNVGAYGSYFSVTPDVVLPLGLGTVDIAQVLRLNDD